MDINRYSSVSPKEKEKLVLQACLMKSYEVWWLVCVCARAPACVQTFHYPFCWINLYFPLHSFNQSDVKLGNFNWYVDRIITSHLCDPVETLDIDSLSTSLYSKLFESSSAVLVQFTGTRTPNAKIAVGIKILSLPNKKKGKTDEHFKGDWRRNKYIL